MLADNKLKGKKELMEKGCKDRHNKKRKTKNKKEKGWRGVGRNGKRMVEMEGKGQGKLGV